MSRLSALFVPLALAASVPALHSHAGTPTLLLAAIPVSLSATGGGLPPSEDACPIQALPSDTELCVSWLNDDGTFDDDVANCWNSAPYAPGVLAVTPTFDYPMIGEGANPGADEWACGLTLGAHEVECFGYATVLAYPIGESPYSALSSGSTGRYGVLNAAGRIRIWGNLSGTFGSAVPTTAGFTELGIGRDVGCAVGIVGGGVTCWGNNIDTLVVNALKPAVDTYTAVEVGRYVAGAVQTDGTLDMWSTTRLASGRVASAQQFIANRPTTASVRSFELGETGELIGVAWMADGTAYLWHDSTIGVPTAVRNAPGWSTYGVVTNDFYIPRGPLGPMTFRSRLEISATDITAQICGVVDDPMGLVNSAGVAYEFGDAICWGSNGEEPRIEARCTSPL